jgi:phage-related protein
LWTGGERLNLFNLFVKIGADTSGAEKGIDDVGKKTSSLGSKVSKGLGVTAKVVGAAVSAAAGGVAALATAATKSYGDYEQLVGGVETLFKESQGVVMEYANNAYKTAGLSANEYMETVTGFSASLLQSLGGDTEKAAKYADMAITDMSDNANKMGTDMSSIQYAYQGFAKQNYTMLDNLKLGYGGTKEEMERLLSDAQKLSGVEYDISSYADIVDAIHVVQTEMGITGTTAKEAATTIQGSVSAMKSAWKNLVIGIADDNQDFNKLVNNFVDSAVTAGNNIIPRIETSIKGIAKLVSSASQSIIPLAVDTIVNALPDVVSAGASLIGSLANAITNSLPTLVASAGDIVLELINGITAKSGDIVSSGATIVTDLAEGISEFAVNLIPAVTTLSYTLWEELTNPSTLSSIMGAALQIIMSLVEGLMEALPIILQSAPVIIGNLVAGLIVMLPQIINAGIEILMSLVNGILNAIPSLVAAIPTITMAIVNGILTNLDEIILAAIQITLSIAMGMIEAIPNMITQLPRIFLAIVNAFKGFSWSGIGHDLLTGIWNGINDKVAWLKSKVQGVVDKIKGWFTGKDGFDEHSPSKWSKKVFQYVMDGGVNGIDAGMPGMMSAVGGAVDSIKNGFDIGTISAGATASGSAQNNIRAAIHDEISKIGIYLDGNTLVGGISDRMNQGLGSIYAGNERRAMA